MNASSNNSSSNQASNLAGLADFDTLISSFGFTQLYTDIYIYAMTPVSCIGFILNLVSFFVFNNSKTKEFNSRNRLYNYLRVYCLNSALVCFVCIFAFTSQTIRQFKWSMDYWPEVYFIYVFVPVINTCYLIETFLDIVILLDRIAQINQNYAIERFIPLSPYKISACVIALSLIVNIFMWFSFSPLSLTVPYLDNNTTISFINLCIVAPSAFSTTIPGLVIYYITTAIREIAVLVVEIWLSVVSVVLLKMYLTQKVRVAQGTSSKRLSSTDRKMTLMVLCMCVMSFAEHFMSLVTLVYNKIPGFDFGLFILLALFFPFSIVVKQSLNFFLFVAFNSRFKTACAQLVANYTMTDNTASLSQSNIRAHNTNSLNNNNSLNNSV